MLFLVSIHLIDTLPREVVMPKYHFAVRVFRDPTELFGGHEVVVGTEQQWRHYAVFSEFSVCCPCHGSR